MIEFKKRTNDCKKGFTLIELVVVMLALSILAAAGTAGYNGMVTHFTERTCIDSRTEAVQNVVSACLQGELLVDETAITEWLKAYPQKNQTNDSENWIIDVEKDNNTNKIDVKISCKRHTHEVVTRSVGSTLR